jgi:hypothetical protein
MTLAALLNIMLSFFAGTLGTVAGYQLTTRIRIIVMVEPVVASPSSSSGPPPAATDSSQPSRVHAWRGRTCGAGLQILHRGRSARPVRQAADHAWTMRVTLPV